MKQRTKKTLSGVTAVACALAVLLTGTFAWQASTSAINPFSGIKEVKAAAANLHDNFNAKTGDKDVFVENTGINPVYVRVKLQEVLDKTQATAPANPQWVTHIPGTTVEKCNHADGYHSAFGSSFGWQMGGASKTYNSITGTTEWASNVAREERDKLVADSLGDTQTANKADTKGTGTGKTLPATTVISMAEYMDKTVADKVAFVGWVYDTDGYAYWSQQLLPGEATGLLLDRVSMPTDETYYYAINVIMEYVDETDLPAWLDGALIKEGSMQGQRTDKATYKANNLLSRISPIKNRVGSIFTASGQEWIVVAIDGENMLVTTKDVIGMTMFMPSSGGAVRDRYAGSQIEEVMTSFYNVLKTRDSSQAGNEMKITEVAQKSDYASKIVEFAGKDASENQAGGLSKVNENGTAVTFALSWQEMRAYMNGKPEIFLAGAAKEQTLSIANMDYDYPTEVYSGAPLYDGMQTYWLRCPGANNTSALRALPGPSHSHRGDGTQAKSGVRPALWISID